MLEKLSAEGSRIEVLAIALQEPRFLDFGEFPHGRISIFDTLPVHYGQVQPSNADSVVHSGTIVLALYHFYEVDSSQRVGRTYIDTS